MTRHLLAVSIGPVQEFIAAARKTRDLWYGSWLLSEVARAGARTLLDAGAELVFPHRDAVAEESDAAVANKLLVILPDGVSPDQAAQAAGEAARDCLRRQLDAVFGNRVRDDRLVDRQRAAAQVAGFLEVQAAWVPLRSDAEYQGQRTRVERLLAGRKALRDFDQPEKSAGRPVSSLDPSRENVVEAWVYADDVRGAQARQRLGIKRGERLDGISLVKRLAPPKRFVSVSRIAVDPWIRRVAQDDPDGPAALRRIAADLDAQGCRAVEPFPHGPASGLQHYQDFPYDTQLFYDDGSADPDVTGRDREGRPLGADHTQVAAAFFQRVGDIARARRLPPPPVYYAVLVADGDRMGSLISSLADKDAHAALSERLVAFARRAGQIVAAHQGALVYAGGDDVLALLPLDRALACADALRRAFPEIVTPGNVAVGRVSLSVGVAIAHYNEPFSEVLRWARAAEQHAKAAGWRDSLAVALHTRTGGDTATTVRHRWAEDPVTAQWGQWIAWHREDALPDGAAYELRGLLAELGSLPDADLAVALPREIGRVLARKRTRIPWAEIAERLLHPPAGGAPPLSELDRAVRFVDGLIVARRLADAVALAEGTPGRAASGAPGAQGGPA